MTLASGRAGTERVRPLPQDHPCARCAIRLETFCGVLDPATLARFKALGSSGRAGPGQCLFHQGESADAVFNITKGSLKLYQLLADGRRQVAAFVRSGDFLGLGPERDYPHSAEALEEVEHCRIPRARFEDFLDAHPEIGRELYRIAARNLAAAHEQMLLLGRKSAQERLATFLIGLFDAAGQDVVRLAMSRADIADHLGLTKETVSRTFTALRRRRLIASVPGDRIRLLEREKLERLAGAES